MRASEKRQSSARLPRATPITTVAILGFVLAVLGFLPRGVTLRGNLHFANALHIFLAQRRGTNLTPEILLLLLVGIPMVIAGIGLIRLRAWGRYLTLVLAAVIAIQVAVNAMVHGPWEIVSLYAAYPVLAFGVLLNRSVAGEFRQNNV